MNRLVRMGALVVIACLVSGCGGATATAGPDGSPQAVATEVPVSGGGRVITGQEALDLYGIGSEPTPGPPAATPQIWFPARAWVEPSILPYDPSETIDFLPMFASTELGGLTGDGIWLGDLRAGEEVVLHGVTEDGSVCLVEGKTEQGWSTKGWVACNRLRFTEE